MTHQHRCALACLALVASLGPLGALLLGLWPGSQPLLSLAVLGLVVAGLLFHGVLVRHLGAADALAHCRAALTSERQAHAAAKTALADSQHSLRLLMGQQEQVRETERNRIARDIHDDLGQHLLALKIEVELAAHATAHANSQANSHANCQAAAPPANPGTAGTADTPASPVSPSSLSRLAQQVDQTIAALRVVIANLRPAVLDDGLQVAIEQHLREFSRLNGIGCQLLAVDAPVGPGARELDVVLLRILRESLANVVRHAQASEVWVALRRSDSAVTLEIRDNGIGMAPQRGPGAGVASAAPGAGHDGTARPGAGFGLAGIADRVAAAGGSFVIDSGPGAGTLLSMSIPLPRLT